MSISIRNGVVIRRRETMSTTVRRTSLSNELQRQNIALRMIRDRIQPLRGAINNYVSDSALQGSGFNAHKNYLTQGHLPALTGLSNGVTALIEANERHISALNNHLRYELYCGIQIDGELSRLDSTINSWWFRSYESLGLFTGWTQAQRNRRTTVNLKQLRLQNYQRATGH